MINRSDETIITQLRSPCQWRTFSVKRSISIPTEHGSSDRTVDSNFNKTGAEMFVVSET